MATQAYGFDPNYPNYGSSNSYSGTGDPDFETGGDINEIAMLQKSGGGRGLPAWLNPNPNALTKELRQTFRGLPGMFDTGALEKTYDDQINTVSGLGGQIATNAAREAIARAGQTGGQVNSSMAKAQAMIPVYSETGKLATDKAQAMLDAAKAHASIQTEVASTLGQLRTSYLSNLAQIHMQKKTMKNQNLNNAAELALRKYQGDQSNTLQLEELAQRGSQFDRQQDLAETMAGFEAAKGRSGQYLTESGPGAGGAGGGTPTIGGGRFISGDQGLYNINQNLNSRIFDLMR